MALRENIQIYHSLDIEAYLMVLQQEYGARQNPDFLDIFLIDTPELPFYRPEQRDYHVSILGFSYTPLSGLLLEVLVLHPELMPNNTFIRWTQEQESILEDTLGYLRSHYPKHYGKG